MDGTPTKLEIEVLLQNKASNPAGAAAAKAQALFRQHFPDALYDARATAYERTAKLAEWAQEIIRKSAEAELGDPMGAAVGLVRADLASIRWARSIIDVCIDNEHGDPASSAAALECCRPTGDAFVQRAVETCFRKRLGCPATAACRLAEKGCADDCWVMQRISEACRSGFPDAPMAVGRFAAFRGGLEAWRAAMLYGAGADS